MNDINSNSINTYVSDLEEHNAVLQRCVTEIADIATRCLDALEAITKADAVRHEILRRAAVHDSANALSIMDKLLKAAGHTAAEAEEKASEPAPPPVAEPHNPDNLTDEQVGVEQGWRLLDRNEVKVRSVSRNIERWGCGWFYRVSSGSSLAETYRTKLSREELAALP